MKKTSVKKLIVTVTALGVLACFPLVSYGASTQPPRLKVAPFNRPIVGNQTTQPEPIFRILPIGEQKIQPIVKRDNSTRPEPIFRILPMPNVHIQ